MRARNIDPRNAGSELVITNLVSFTLIVSAVVILGALCRFVKDCCARLFKKKDHDVIAFTEVRRLSQARRSFSAPKINTQEYTIVHEENIPLHTEESSVQPQVCALKKHLYIRPRSPTDPEQFSRVMRQISAPAPYTAPTSPLAERLISKDWSSHVDIKTSDLKPQLYKKEASLQKFQTSNKDDCGTLDTEIIYDINTSVLKVKINSIHQILHKHEEETTTYISVRKIPDQNTRRTSVHTKAVDPVYNDLFTFHIGPRDDVTCHVLIYGLHHVDKFSASHLRGEACLPLFQIDLNSRRRVNIPFVEIKKSLFSSVYPTYHNEVTGCILVSLKHEVSKQSFVVNPVRVKYVPRKRHVGYGKNVYIKVALRYKDNRITKMKTDNIEMERMTGRDGNFYQATIDKPLTLDYKSFPPEDTEIHISLNHYLFLKNSFIIGQVKMSRKETGYESTHFQQMLDSPEEQISAWYEMRGLTSPAAMEEIK